MRRFLASLFVFILLFTVMASAQFYQEALEFSGSSSTTLVTTGKDTTDAFVLAKDYSSFKRYASDYPAGLALQIETTEVNDSTWVSYELQLSLDGTNWKQHAVLDTIITADGFNIDTISSWQLALYGRVIVTAKLAAADTVYVSGLIAKKY